MEVLKSFILFGIIENFILLMFYKYVGRIDKVRYWHLIIICPIVIFLSLLQIPFMKQLSSIIVIVAYLSILNKKISKDIFKIVILSFIYLLLIEMVFCATLDFLKVIDLTKIDIFQRFVLMIPIRLVEIFPILAYRKRGRNHWVGTGYRSLKDSKKTTKKLK